MQFQECFQEQKNVFTMLWEEFVDRRIFPTAFCMQVWNYQFNLQWFCLTEEKIGHAAVVIIFLFKRWKVCWDGGKWDLDLMLHAKNGLSHWTRNSGWLVLSGPLLLTATSTPVWKDSITSTPWLSCAASLFIGGVRMTLLTTRSIVTLYTKSYGTSMFCQAAEW